jgi:hypothetical protein
VFAYTSIPCWFGSSICYAKEIIVVANVGVSKTTNPAVIMAYLMTALIPKTNALFVPTSEINDTSVRPQTAVF